MNDFDSLMESLFGKNEKKQTNEYLTKAQENLDKETKILPWLIKARINESNVIKEIIELIERDYLKACSKTNENIKNFIESNPDADVRDYECNPILQNILSDCQDYYKTELLKQELDSENDPLKHFKYLNDRAVFNIHYIMETIRLDTLFSYLEDGSIKINDSDLTFDYILISTINYMAMRNYFCNYHLENELGDEHLELFNKNRLMDMVKELLEPTFEKILIISKGKREEDIKQLLTCNFLYIIELSREFRLGHEIVDVIYDYLEDNRPFETTFNPVNNKDSIAYIALSEALKLSGLGFKIRSK